MARVATITGIVIIALLCAVCLGLAFQGGGYVPSSWLPFLIGASALAVVAAVGGPTVLSVRFQRILLALFAVQVAWTAASILWAGSAANVWEEVNRSLFYAVGAALAFVAVRWAGWAGLTALAALVTGMIGVMALVVAIRLGVSADPLAFLLDGRLNYPVTYYNGLAALLMIGFWLALGVANAAGRASRRPAGDAARDPAPSAAGHVTGVARRRARSASFPRWTQPVLLALAVFLLELALLPQSRGALWTFFLVVPLFVILSPHRFRALVDLAMVSLPVVIFWDKINGVFLAASDNTSVGVAVSGAMRAIGYSIVLVLAAWAVSWVVERAVGPLSRRLAFWIGVALVVVAVAGAAGGLLYADQRTGGLDGYLHGRWAQFTSDSGASTESGTRFTALGLNGRLAQWKVAAQAFEENPLLGIGAQNFEIYFYQHRTTLLDVRQPHSQPMQLIAELGLPGLLLWLAFVALTLVRAGVVRFRSPDRAQQAIMAAMITAAISWFIHSSADWLWQMIAVSLPAMMLLGGLIGAETEQNRIGASERLGGESGFRNRRPLGLGRISVPASGRSRWVRPVAVLLALLVVASASFPYLSMRYSDLAAAATVRDPQTALARTATAAILDPTSAMPYSVRAGVYAAAAGRMPEGSPSRLVELRLAAAAWVDATKVEPNGWLYYFNAATAFLAARNAAVGSEPGSAGELAASARTYLAEARRLNPLSPQVAALEKDF